MVNLLRTHAALRHLDDFSTREGFDPFRDAFVELLCVRSIAIMCIAEVEEIVAAKIETRLGGALDSRVALFLSSNLSGIVRRTQKSDFIKTIKLFGVDCADRFNNAFEPREISAYENVRAARHLNAHGEGSDLGYTDLVVGVYVAEKIIEKFEECIA